VVHLSSPQASVNDRISIKSNQQWEEKISRDNGDLWRRQNFIAVELVEKTKMPVRNTYLIFV